MPIRKENGALSARQEGFCQGMAKGATQRQAYLAATDRHISDKAADQASAALMKNPLVVARIAEIQAQSAARIPKTIESLVAVIDEAIEMARALGRPNVMVDGVMAQGKLLGLIIDRAQVETIVRRPAPDAQAQPGVLLTEVEWERRILPPGRELELELKASGYITNGHTANATANAKEQYGQPEHEPEHDREHEDDTHSGEHERDKAA